MRTKLYDIEKEEMIDYNGNSGYGNFRSPVEVCLRNDNRGVFRLFLELGLLRDTVCCANPMNKTLLEYCLKYQPPKIMKLLNSVMPGWDRNASCCPWWTHKYTQERNSSLQQKIEELITRGEISEILWIGLRGGYLLRPDILASKEFEDASPLMRTLVWLLLVPEATRRAYQRWLQQNSPNAIGLLPHKKPKAAAKENFRKLLLSRELFPNQDFLEILADDDKILLLKYLSEEVHLFERNWQFAWELHPILCNDILLKS